MRRREPGDGQAALFTPPPEPDPEPEPLRMDPHVYLPRDPRPTQVTAAAAALPKSGTQRARVLDAIRAAGQDGLTDEEIGVTLALALNSVRPRRLELVEAELVVDSGRRRRTPLGMPATVWVTVP